MNVTPRGVGLVLLAMGGIPFLALIALLGWSGTAAFVERHAFVGVVLALFLGAANLWPWTESWEDFKVRPGFLMLMGAVLLVFGALGWVLRSPSAGDASGQGMESKRAVRERLKDMVTQEMDLKARSETERLAKAKQLGRTAGHFKFLRPGMSLNQVLLQGGKPDREYNGGQFYWEYDLGDGSEVVIAAKMLRYGDWSTNTVAWYGQRRGTNWLWTKPDDERGRRDPQ
ncbi:hypothetical protein IT570_12340 [Candidatus Sumerlaeota bacterium]|nr:hypothetical protein [Candidatus Sumerlaeota bacterium]